MIHSLDLSITNSDCLVIYAHLGLGRTVVEGKTPIDTFVVERRRPFHLKSADIAVKTSFRRPAAGGGEEEVVITGAEQNRPSLAEEQITTLAAWSRRLERYFKRPQEIEWALDQHGQLWILQSRRLISSQAAVVPEICESCALYPILLQEQGAVAHAGVGVGPVFQVLADQDMERFPEGAVLVTRYTAPWLARSSSESRSHCGRTGVAGRPSSHHCPGVSNSHSRGCGQCHRHVASGP